MEVRTEGPNKLKEGHSWLIDARDDAWPEGQLIHITMTPDPQHGTRKVAWEAMPEDGGPAERQTFQHKYFLMGSWGSQQMSEMHPVRGQQGAHELAFKMGPSGQESFQVCRDGDPEQVFYPAYPRAQRSTVPVRGPDHLSAGKSWVILGEQGETVVVRIKVENGHVEITASSPTLGGRKWQSVDGRDRKCFFVQGTWLEKFSPMVEDTPNIYKLQVVMGDEGFEEFQVLMDEDPGRAYYPEAEGNASGQVFVCGPDDESRGRNFRIEGVPGMEFEIVLDLRIQDRRKIVTWRPLVEGGLGALPWSNSSPLR